MVSSRSIAQIAHLPPRLHPAAIAATATAATAAKVVMVLQPYHPGRNNFTCDYLNDVSFTCTSEPPPTRVATRVGADGLRCVPWHCCGVRQHARQARQAPSLPHSHVAFTHGAADAQCARCESWSPHSQQGA